MQGVNMVDIGNLAVKAVSNVSKSASDGKNDFSSFLDSGKNKIEHLHGDGFAVKFS